MSDNDSVLRQRVLTMQIIAGALPMGLVVFFGIVLFLVYGQAGPPRQLPALPMVSLIAVVFVIMSGSMSLVVPHFLTLAELRRRAASPGDGDVIALLNVKQTTLIVGLALLEGPAFLGLIAFLVERQPLVLIVPGLCLAAMLMRFPTENSVRNWLESAGRRVLELRQDRSGAN